MMRPVPDHIKRFVTKIGGRNRLGGPLFRVVWGPDRLENCGGVWMDLDGTSRMEMRQVRKYGSTPVFHLEKWVPPEAYGSWESWELENAYKLENNTPELGIQIIGAYPHRGEYEHSYQLSGRLYLYTLEKLIRLNLMGRLDRTTPEQRIERRRLEEEKKKQEWKQMVIDLYKDRAPAFYGAVSFAGQKNHTALMDRLDTVVKQLEHGITGDEMKKAIGLGFKQTK